MAKKLTQEIKESVIPKEQIKESPVTILVVDDDDAARETLGDLLEMKHFHVTTTGSGTEALEILKKASFNLVISDLKMPQMDGITLTKKVREMGLDLPVIVMTGFASIEHAVESMKAGASDFITKPFNSDQIQIIIKRTLETKRLEKLAKEREYYENLSNIDGLTDLNNFRCFSQIIQVEIERQRRYKRPLSLMMIDIDNFKFYNDTYGHLYGDNILKQIAFLIKKATRGCDIVARYGGEEFVVILPETPEKEAVSVGRRILDAIKKFNFETPDGKSLGRITVTIGISSFPDDAQDKGELIDKADQAMYRGKASGKNCVVVFGKTRRQSLHSKNMTRQ